MGLVSELSCGAKDRFPSRGSALAVLARQRGRSDRKGKRRAPLQAFRCAACRGWHIGTPDPDRTRAGADTLGVYGGAR